jgi:DNA-binding response OmpR family regulator
MRILIIEDDKRIRINLEKMLKNANFAVDTSENGRDGLDKARDEEYDAIVLDWRLPDLEGILVCQKLREEKITTPIIMLTAKSELEDKLKGLNTGADDYLTKPFEAKELLARIHAIIRRKGTINTQPIITIADLKIDTNCCQVWRNGKEITLSPKEYSLLEYLAKYKGKVIDRVELLSHVWDENADLFSNTVDVHIWYLREKIDKDSKLKLIKTVKGKGYAIYE